MRKLCLLIAFMLAVPIVASAQVISHRYLIFDTDYSIEFPSEFLVVSEKMGEYEPAVIEWGYPLEEAQNVVKESGCTIVAYTSIMKVYIQTFEIADTELSTLDATDEELDEAAQLLANEFFGSRPYLYPLFDDPSGEVYHCGDMVYLTWSYKTDPSTDASSSEYVFIDNGHMVMIEVEKQNASFGEMMVAADIEVDILRSIKKVFLQK